MSPIFSCHVFSYKHKASNTWEYTRDLDNSLLSSYGERRTNNEHIHSFNWFLTAKWTSKIQPKSFYSFLFTCLQWQSTVENATIRSFFSYNVWNLYPQPQIVMILKFSIKKTFLDVILLLKHQKHMMLSKEKYTTT